MTHGSPGVKESGLSLNGFARPCEKQEAVSPRLSEWVGEGGEGLPLSNPVWIGDQGSGAAKIYGGVCATYLTPSGRTAAQHRTCL